MNGLTRRRKAPWLALIPTTLLCFVACQRPSAEAPQTDESAATASESAPVGQTAEKPPFDYPGGWLDEETCVDICGVTPESPVERPKAVVCFNSEDADCQAKTGDGDYDYLMLSQHWLPTMCLGLDAGYDSTVTHQAGSRCTADAPSRLTLHGLWPNYNAGFPQCCGSGAPLGPEHMAAWPAELRERLWAEQPDPTVANFEPAVCEIFNHEWQKHGTCFQDTGDVSADARAYFELGLELTDRLAEASGQLNAWAGSSQERGAIEALYPKAVQILCDAHQLERLLEVHTCWSRDGDMVDCAPTKGFGSLRACEEQVKLPRWEG